MSDADSVVSKKTRKKRKTTRLPNAHLRRTVLPPGVYSRAPPHLSSSVTSSQTSFSRARRAVKGIATRRKAALKPSFAKLQKKICLPKS